MAISIPYPNFQDGQTIVAAQHNANNAEIATFVDALQAGTNFNTGAIGTTSIADDAITGAKIAANAVDISELASAVANALNPTGVIQAYVGTVAPTGWLVCDGSAFSSTTYPNLYALLGNVATTPDLRDKFLAGASATKTIRTSGGSATIGVNNLPAHTHPNTITSVTVAGTVSVTLAGGDHSHSATIGTVGSTHNHALPTVRQGPASSAHSGSTTIAAGFSGSDVNLNTGSVGSEHTHNITIDSANAGVSVSGASFTQTSGSAVISNQPNATTASDYWQPYYAVTYIIKAA